MSHPARSRILAFALATFFLSTARIAAQQSQQPLAPAPTQRAAIDLVVAGRARGIVIALIGPNDIWVPIAYLRATKILFPASGSGTIGGIEYLSLRSLEPGMTYAFDESTLTLNIYVQNASLFRDSDSIDLGEHNAQTLGAHAETSGFVNYSITDATNNPGAVSGYTELGFSNEWGHLTATGSYDNSEARRGLIAYSIDQESFLRRETVGDELATSGILGSSVVVGGIGVSRAFELQPGFLRDPAPALAGTVLSPTRADIYINGTLYRSVELAPGQFSLNDLPVPPGANVTQVVLEDASGTTTDITAAYYSAPTVLRQGVNEYSYHVGFIRPQPYEAADYYGPLAGLGFYRVGLTNAITLGATFEKGEGQIDGGPTLDLRLPLGALSLAGSASDAAGVNGKAATGTYTFSSNRLTLAAFGSLRSALFSTLTLEPSTDRATKVAGESAAFRLTPALSLGFSHVNTRYRDTSPTDVAAFDVDVRPTRVADFRFSFERDRGSALNPNALTANASSWTIGTTLTLQLGQSIVATVQSENVAGHGISTLEVFGQPPIQYGLGYDMQGTLGAPDSMNGVVSYRSQFADVNSLVSSGTGGTSFATTISGGVGIFDRGVFFGEPIQSAYGLVQVEGLNDVPVFFNGIQVGTTGKRDAIMVPNLSPYVDNAISLGNFDTETNIEEDAAQKFLDPRFNSAVSTVFHIRRVQIFIGRLTVERDGRRFVPAFGAMAILGPGRQQHSDLGDSGQFYFENLSPGLYHATAIYAANGTCAFDFRVGVSKGLQVDLGALTCIER